MHNLTSKLISFYMWFNFKIHAVQIRLNMHCTHGNYQISSISLDGVDIWVDATPLVMTMLQQLPQIILISKHSVVLPYIILYILCPLTNYLAYRPTVSVLHLFSIVPSAYRLQPQFLTVHLFLLNDRFVIHGIWRICA